MAPNVIDKTNRIYRGGIPTISARKAAELWGVSTSLVTAAIENETLWPQSRIQDGPNDKPAYGFHRKYIKEVLPCLPKKRVPNQKVFNAAVKARLQPLNEKWKKCYPNDDPGTYLIQMRPWDSPPSRNHP